jgi:hypothetical protein
VARQGKVVDKPLMPTKHLVEAGPPNVLAGCILSAPTRRKFKLFIVGKTYTVMANSSIASSSRSEVLDSLKLRQILRFGE